MMKGSNHGWTKTAKVLFFGPPIAIAVFAIVALLMGMPALEVLGWTLLMLISPVTLTVIIVSLIYKKVVKNK